MMHGKTIAAGVVIVALAAGGVLTQEATKSADQAKQKDAKSDQKDAKGEGGKVKTPPAKPATHKVARKHFKIEVTAKGILEGEETTEIAFRPQPSMGGPFGGVGPLSVRKAVEHGARVRPGDLLIALETQRIDQMIQQIETDKKLLDAGIKLSQEELPLLEKAVPLDLAAAEQAKKQADEDLKYFLDVSRPESEKRAHQMVKSASFSLEFAKEELRQLEKMYKANDLTEDTEEIILKRQRYYVEISEIYHKNALISRDLILKTDLPRRELAMKDNAATKTLLLEKAKNTLVPLVNQRKQALAKMLHDRDKLHDALEKMQKDRQAMTITAPAEGVVYYGRFSKGQWEAASSMANRLVPHGIVMPDDVLMTIVKTRPLTTRLSIDEKDAYLIKPGLQGKAQMVYQPDRKFVAKVARVSNIPAAPGKFEIQAGVELSADGADLMPGMACTVKFVPYQEKEAIVVPAGSVFEDDDKHFVYLADKSGKHTKREVTPGRTAEGETEIREGLHVGDEILLQRPDDKGKPAAPTKEDKKEVKKGELP